MYYTLDSTFQPVSVIEGFNSFIWTERYSAYGDFQIITKSTFNNRQLLAPDTWLGRTDSKYLMQIKTVTDAVDDQGNKLITVVGKSMEALLLDRVAYPALIDTTTTPNWVLTGTPGNIAREMFNQICCVGALSTSDSIPQFSFGSIYPPGNLGESTDTISVAVTPDYLYNSLKSVCDAYGLGFRLIRGGTPISPRVYFEVYVGNNRTLNQSSLPPVVFDPDMENLADVNQVTSTDQNKTVAYVFAQNGSAIVYAPNVNPDDQAASRRVLLVNSSNTNPAGPVLTAELEQEGTQALAMQTTIYSFDGTVPQSNGYVYGVDYNLGDLVEERVSDGNGNQMIVTEQIFSSDNTGETSYPTLTLLQTITPGSWLSWTPPGQVWDDVDPSIHWDDL